MPKISLRKIKLANNEKQKQSPRGHAGGDSQSPRAPKQTAKPMQKITPQKVGKEKISKPILISKRSVTYAKNK